MLATIRKLIHAAPKTKGHKWVSLGELRWRCDRCGTTCLDIYFYEESQKECK